MGGRGASSASGKKSSNAITGGINQGGLRIEWPDGTTQTLYFDSNDGINYWRGNAREGFTGVASPFEQVPEEVPDNLSKSQLKKNAEKNGARVTDISAKKRDSMEKKRREERKKCRIMKRVQIWETIKRHAV